MYDPTSQEIEDENFDLVFSFIASSSEREALLVKIAKNVSEIDEVLCEQIDYEEISGRTIDEEIINIKEEVATKTSQNVVAKDAPKNTPRDRQIKS